ncbi:thioredoxin domain-containing protein [Undibacterium sp. Xuan67W]|uniref:thioredoxin family protein n=1 Tax=Undibacterium sp. Xuan67W TaxID=3413057 RepID=UPI003BF01DCA
MISQAQLDPWDDASLLAQRLSPANAQLFILIGAEQWCAKCRDLRPQFDSLAAQAKLDEVWLWLDLEDHAEFIGDYLPENLPMLIAYQGENIVLCQVVEDAEQSLNEYLEPIRAIRHAPYSALPTMQDPGIRSRLLLQDWASE